MKTVGFCVNPVIPGCALTRLLIFNLSFVRFFE